MPFGVLEPDPRTLEQLAVMPFRPRDVFLGKVLPYFAVAAVDLGAESGFDLARRLDLDQDVRSHVILISTHAEEDFADLIATSPALGFVSKSRLSSDAIERILERRDAGPDGRPT